MQKLEPKKQKVMFWHESTSAQKSEIDLILTHNESVQKVGIQAYTQFSSIRYLQLRVFFILFMEKSSAKILVKDYYNMLIRVAKLINEKVISIEIWEWWQKFKVYKMFLNNIWEIEKLSYSNEKSIYQWEYN